MSKALACLASLAAASPRSVWRRLTATRLAQCLRAKETQYSALRLVVNLATDTDITYKLFDGGIGSLVVAALGSDSVDIKKLAVSCLSNMTPFPECR